MKDSRFYICKHCKNLVGMINDSGVSIVCCGEKMTRLDAGVVEASREKHIPVVTVDGDNVKVCVGSVLHPMAEEHNIAWVYLETTAGGQRKNLPVNGEPTVEFTLNGEKAVAVYAYCNLHGLWKAEI